MKLNLLLISTVSAILFSGCNYSESKTTSTSVNSENGFALSKSTQNSEKVDIAGESYELKRNTNITSDGTVSGTNVDFNFDILTPDFKKKMAGNYDLATSYTKEQGIIIMEKADKLSQSALIEFNKFKEKNFDD